MTDINSSPNPAEDKGAARPTTIGAPRWVKIFGIIVVIVILLFVIFQLMGIKHGPGQHIPAGSIIGENIWLFFILQAAI